MKKVFDMDYDWLPKGFTKCQMLIISLKQLALKLTICAGVQNDSWWS